LANFLTWLILWVVGEKYQGKRLLQSPAVRFERLNTLFKLSDGKNVPEMAIEKNHDRQEIGRLNNDERENLLKRLRFGHFLQSLNAYI